MLGVLADTASRLANMKTNTLAIDGMEERRKSSENVVLLLD